MVKSSGPVADLLPIVVVDAAEEGDSTAAVDQVFDLLGEV
jgi:hypothetical protein